MSRNLSLSICAIVSVVLSGTHADAQSVFKAITSTSPIKLVDSTGTLLGPLLEGKLAGSDNSKDAFSIRVNAAGFVAGQVTFLYESSNCTGTQYILAPWELLPPIAGTVGIGTPDPNFGSYASAKFYYPSTPYVPITQRSYNRSDDPTCTTSGPDNVIAGLAKYVTASGFTPPFYAKSQ
jgi:hypothetical protein